MLNKNSRTSNTLKRFAKYVIQQARTNLTKGKKNVNKELYNSLKFRDQDFKVSPNSIEFNIKMEKYGEFVDKGVKGVKSNYIENRESPFSYKQSSNLIGLENKTGTFAKWAKAKGLRYRNVKGQFLSYKSMGFILATSIKNKGLKSSMFFTKPFEKGLKTLNAELEKSFAFDVATFMEFALKKNQDKNIKVNKKI